MKIGFSDPISACPASTTEVPVRETTAKMMPTTTETTGETKIICNLTPFLPQMSEECFSS